MLDVSTSPPADFGLEPLPLNVDESLLLSASARWNECCDQWLELMAQGSRLPLDSLWWSARAQGTAVSRRALGNRLYRQHFEASSHAFFALGNLRDDEMKTLQTIIDPTLHPAPDAAVNYVEQLTLNSADGRRAELPGALVITRDSAQPVAQLLYLPARQSAWQVFSSRDEMERWLIEQHPQLVGPSRLDADTVTVAYTALTENPLDASAESLLTRLSGPEVSKHQLDEVFASPPELAHDRNEETSADPAALFGLLSPEIPLDLRRQALAQQQSALENLLDNAFQGNADEPRLLELQRQLDALSSAEQASTRAATALLASTNPLHMLELRNLPNAEYAALYEARLAGLRAEADVQLALSQISGEEHQWVITALDAVDHSNGHADVVVARLTLLLTEANSGSTTTQTHELDGVLLFAHPSALQSDAAQSLLLYWPGRFGGLQRFGSRLELEQTLFKITANDKALALQFTTLTANPVEYALQQQLYNCEQQAARLIADNAVASRASQRVIAMDKLREQTLARLTVPISSARELAFSNLQEQHHSSGLAGNLPRWFAASSAAQRAKLKGLFTSYITAMKRSHALLERELPPRETFSKKAIDAHLREAFGLTQNVEVMLNLPDTTHWQKVVSDGAAPGTPQQNELVASPQRSKLSLAGLAQGNIDQAMWWRLSFMQVEISGADEAQRQKMKSAMTQAWLRKVVTELDLAGKYETLIRDTFLGSSNASTFSNEHRRECLSEPWRLMLKLQGEIARMQHQISAAGLQVLQIAIDADNREAYAANGKRIVLLPAHLTVGGADTRNQGPSTLAGVTFIQEQITGLTLLYLPDSPDDQCLREYDSLEEARKALFNLCLRTPMVNYLADRALTGDVAHHVSRINQALLKNFDALIGTGNAWPATTSLAAHLLNVHMGRLLEAHRATSRSNDALLLERVALQSGAMFDYLKMAVGMLPFVGAAVALYDAWTSANQAVAAFLRGQFGHGLAEVETLLLSLIDAAMDVLPGAAATPSVARAATRNRQLRRVASGALQAPPQRQARHAVERFRGYEYEHDISLSGLQPGTQGVYRNVYRHTEGDFMLSQGRLYRIELSSDARQWRLHGTSTRPYKQPIALDEAGNWNTHYAVYGTVIEGGGAGGGAVLGHMADGLDPLWPAAIRRWLPRWWTDRALRRQLTLTNTADAYTRRLDIQTRTTNAALEQYFALELGQRQPMRARVDMACANDIEIAQNQFLNLEELMHFSHGRKRAMIEDIQSRCAWIIVERSIRRVTLTKDLLIQHLNRVDQLLARSDTTPASDTAAHLRLTAQRKEVRKDFLKEFDKVHEMVGEAHRWNRRITNRAQKSMMARDIANLSDKFSDANYYYLKTAHVLEIITRYDAVDDLPWVYFHLQLKGARDKVGRALFNQHHLPEVHASHSQRNKVLEDCLATYAEFRRNLSAWTLGYPQHLDLEQVAAFLDDLEKVEDFARQAIKNRPTPTPGARASSKQLFETEDNQLLIGVASTDAATRQKHFTVEGVDGRTETWLPRSGGKYRLSEPVGSAQPQLPTDVTPLLTEARKRLASVDAYKQQVEGYARRSMLPVDLEHMMNREATELTTRAQAIERLTPTEPVARQLRRRADELSRAGRMLRIDQSMNSKTPTEGYLDYLLEQQVVDIRKEGRLRELGKRPDGRRDFLQEYEVRDLRVEPAQTLWYAHFHYTSAKPAFNEFVKGHLKLPEQRNLGLQWQQAQADRGAQVQSIWRGDIGKPLGSKHFSGL